MIVKYELRPIQSFGSVLGGGTPKAEAINWNGPIPFITPTELAGLDGKLVGEAARSITEAGVRQSALILSGVLVSCRAPIGAIGTTISAVSFNQGCKGIPIADERQARYLAYALVASRDKLEATGNGTTFSEISSTVLGQIRVPAPPLEIQRAIADYLDRETAEIDAMSADLDEMEALLTERRRSVVSNLTSNTSWEYVSLRSLASAPGGLFTDGDWVELKDQDPRGHIRLLQLADVGDGFFRDKTDKWVNDEKFDVLDCTSLCEGDILIARMPDPIARAAIVPDLRYRAITVVDVAILRAPPTEDPRYLMHAINSAEFRSCVESKVAGSTRQRISRSALGREAIRRPELVTQRRIADEIDRETAEIDAMLADIAELRDLLAERRAAVIAAAVTGQIDIPAAKETTHA